MFPSGAGNASGGGTRIVRLFSTVVDTLTATEIESGRANWLTWLAAARAWLFLAILFAVFEIWARFVYHTTFLFNPFNVQSIAVFAVSPLLLALGQTLVIISGGIDLSVGFTMGFAAVVFAHCVNLTSDSLGVFGSLLVGMIVALV